LLAPANAFEIVAWRIVLSLVFCAILLTVTRGWRRLVMLMREWRVMLTLAVAGILILINWLVYVLATLSGQVVQASLGYFMNPILTVLLGVIVLRERLRSLQWVSIGISVIAVAVLIIDYRAVPWIALALTLSFGFYGLIKKRVAGRVDAVSGLTIETTWLAPLAFAQLVVLWLGGTLTMGTVSTLQTVAMLFAGVITATPLLLFAGAARRLPLTTIGLTQYVTPILQFLIGVLLLREAMPAPRLVGFTLIWVALGVLTIDSVMSTRRDRRRKRADSDCYK
jgi:chloramphenicol-sensitive protein RarD